MKILFITRFYKPHIGGVETHINMLIEQLNNNGHAVDVITTKFSSKQKSYENRTNNVWRIKYSSKKIIGLIDIWRWVMKNKNIFRDYDVIHCHDVFIWLLPIKVLYPNIKIFITFHGYENYPLRTSSIIIHRLSGYLSQGNITIGKFINKWYGTKSNLISYGAVDRKLFNKNIPSIKYEYLFSGRLDDQTSVLKYLTNQIKGKVIFVGDGPLRKKCEEYGPVTGFVDNPIPYYKKAKIILASRYLSILEALALNKPIYAIYDNPIKRDYLTLTPFSKWIKIGTSFKNYHNYQISNEAKKWIKQQTWEKMCQNYLTLWNK